MATDEMTEIDIPAPFISDDFLKEVIDVWEQGFMGIDVGNILISLGIFFGFLVVRGIFSLSLT